ncbi:hypothetical protein LPJ75_007397, partial [Coemansia sp. RSA 2598]
MQPCGMKEDSKQAKTVDRSWCFEVDSNDGCPEASGKYVNSLRACLTQQTGGKFDRKAKGRDASDGNGESQPMQSEYSITADQCERILVENEGALDLLVRLYFFAASEFGRAPQRLLESGRLRHVLVRVLMEIHEAAVDAAVRNSDAEGIMLALALVADAQAARKDDGVLQHMRNEWVQAADRISRNCDLELAKAWAGYEASVLDSDIENAL